jgi:xanthine dehydrogenase small subunit
MVEARPDFSFHLNGRNVRVSGEPPQTTLLDFVRAQGLTGTKEGCAEGECGACAVLIVGPAGALRSVNSCLIPLPGAAQQEIYTAEGLAESGKLADVQRAMAEHGGSQCGYCTPGFAVSMFAEQCRAPQGRRDVHALGGNLCRCTGYRPIRDALDSLGPSPPAKPFARQQVPALRYKTEAGCYSRPSTLRECLELAAEDPSARYVAGNTDLGVLTNLRDARYSHLIGVESIAELREFSHGPDAVEIGGALTLSEIAEKWHDAPAAFREWLELFASILISNRATLGGNLATASPIGDSAPLLLALGAEVRIAGLSGERMVPLREFFRAYRQTALEPGELLRSIRIPRPFPRFIRFYKVAKRRLDDISTVAAGIAMDRDESGTVTRVRLAFGGVAATPLRTIEAEDALEGTGFAPSDLERAREALRRTLRPIDDHRGSAAYRIAMAQSLIDKFRYEEMA